MLDDLYQQVDQGKVGAFFGKLLLEWVAHGDWLLRQQPDPFSFVRANGEQILPESIHTDGGSIPRPFWNLPGMDPTYYMPAYVLHDYMFERHEKRKGVPCSFDEANLILAEMLVALNCPRERVVLIYEAIEQSPQGRKHWDKSVTTIPATE